MMDRGIIFIKEYIFKTVALQFSLLVALKISVDFHYYYIFDLTFET